jgi:hypothetical protein
MAYARADLCDLGWCLVALLVLLVIVRIPRYFSKR